MLQSISYRQLLEWKTFEELEPWAEERADYNAAHIVQFLWSLSGATTHPGGRPLSDFLLPFGDAARVEKAPQPLAYQEMLIDAWIGGSNAVFANEATKQ